MIVLSLAPNRPWELILPWRVAVTWGGRRRVCCLRPGPESPTRQFFSCQKHRAEFGLVVAQSPRGPLVDAAHSDLDAFQLPSSGGRFGCSDESRIVLRTGIRPHGVHRDAGGRGGSRIGRESLGARVREYDKDEVWPRQSPPGSAGEFDRILGFFAMCAGHLPQVASSG